MFIFYGVVNTTFGEGNGNPLQCLAWRIPGTGEPGGLPSMGSHRVGRDWSDLAAAVAAHASKVMLKILQARLQQCVNHEFPDVQTGFRKDRGTEIKLPTPTGSSEKLESSRKTSISALLTMLKLLTMWITTNCGKFLKRWEYQTTWPASWEIFRSRSNSQNWTWNSRLVPNWERSTSRLYIVTLLI